MTDERCASRVRGVEKRDQPIGQRFDGGQRVAAGAPVSGQVDRVNVAAVIGEVARLEREDAVVAGGAVDEYQIRSRSIRLPRAGVGVNVVAADTAQHQRTLLPAACSARPRSSIKSSGSS